MSLTYHFVLIKLYTEPSIGLVLKKIILIGQSQTRTVYVGHISCMIGTNYGNVVQDLPYTIHIKLKFIVSPSLISEEKIF